MSAGETWVLPVVVRRAIVAHARADAPRECCGFLLGRGRLVSHAAPMTNVARGTTRYRVRDRDHIGLRRALRGLSPPLEIVGVYHSHPRGPARPSRRDLDGAHYPEWLHVIVGVMAARAEVRGFRLDHRAVRAVRLHRGAV